ncbi:diacylglycerol kinase [Inhella proteolytica]|uniref:Diacylglycerol kinase n=1 Tax=Inhella proteolytica TaxID=2795029 RepID=A0A931J2Y1_9BURK|nr:diacylglycerol kinase [Inhella proteolytica]MBH9578604.1 diacylglycerol kinase [Inhella proteolytica]
MSASTDPGWKSRGFTRIAQAARHQSAGIWRGLRHDPATGEVSIACWVLCIVALLLPVPRIEHLLLVLSLLLVVLVEYLNSAIEAAVDRVSLEPHPLSRDAKDYASVAVGLAALMALLCWLVIAGPVFAVWMAQLLAANL